MSKEISTLLKEGKGAEALLAIKRLTLDSAERILLKEQVVSPIVDPTTGQIDITNADSAMPSKTELMIVSDIISAGRMLGGDEGTYNEGVLFIELRNKAAAVEFSSYLEANDNVDGYEMYIKHLERWEGYQEDEEVDLDDITDDKNFFFEFFIYLNPDIVTYAPSFDEVDEAEAISESIEDGEIFEVKRVVKVNFKGKKRIKMQCNPGFKWDPAKRACVKITGAQLSTMRKALRKAVISKRSQGSGYRARIARKTRKAKRFRASMGVK